MSRRKQSNPKPFLKSESQNNFEEMTIEPESLSMDRMERHDITCEIDTGKNKIPEETKGKEDSHISSIEFGSDVASNQTLDSADNVTLPFVNDDNAPKLRLNISLASDPALKPNAKDLKITHNECEEIIETPLDTSNKEVLSCKAQMTKAKLSNAPDAMTTRMKVFMCAPCGIGFSSPSTLEAHQSYYCSHRKDADDDTTNTNMSIESSGEPSTKSSKTGKQYTCSQCSYSADKKVSLNRHMRMHQSSPTPSSNASNGDESSSHQIDRYCTDCDIRFSNVKTYRAHKQHYCSSRRSDGQPTSKIDTVSTIPKPSGIVSPSDKIRSKTPTQSSLNSASQSFLALPTNPIIILPCSIIQTASVIPGPLTALLPEGLMNPERTCFTLLNGSLNPMATAINTSSSKLHFGDSISDKESTSSTLPLILTENNVRTTNQNEYSGMRKNDVVRELHPLDLSLRKLPKQIIRRRSNSSISQDSRIDNDTMIECRENISHENRSISPEQIVCAPSLPNSPSLSPSPKRRLISPKICGTSPSSPISNILDNISLKALLPNEIQEPMEIAPMTLKVKSISDSTHLNIPTLPIASVTPSSVGSSSNVGPHIYVKQGVSKCKECNIVFCKYENYLAHKQHYCSARNYDEIDPKLSPTPPSVLNKSESSSLTYHQLICAACGIKYTSLDNLRAHQKFYCPKGCGPSSHTLSVLNNDPSSNSEFEQAKKNKVASLSTTQQSQDCEVPILNLTEEKKHLDNNAGGKTFRCSICRYRGSTIRGMRTHIRMHFEKKPSEFSEESYLSCILEDDGIDIRSPSMTTIPQTIAISTQQFNCDVCNYSSSYKGNVLRHMKLVHTNPMNSPSMSPEIDEELLARNSEDISSNIKMETSDTTENNTSLPTNNVKTIKEEPIDNEIDIADETPPTTSSAAPGEALNASVSPLSGDENALKNTLNNQYCHTCDIKFNFLKTYLAHKQFYCKNTKRTDGDNPSSGIGDMQSPILIKNKENLETII